MKVLPLIFFSLLSSCSFESSSDPKFQSPRAQAAWNEYTRMRDDVFYFPKSMRAIYKIQKKNEAKNRAFALEKEYLESRDSRIQEMRRKIELENR